MSDDRIRCRSCGETVEGELGQIDHALSAASRSDGEVRIIYTAIARTMLERVAEQIAARRLSIAAIETEIVRTESPR